AVFPDRLMTMHARAIVAIDRFRHEGRRLPVDLRHLRDAVFVDLHSVGHLRQRRELHSQLMLRGADFVMVLFHFHAHARHGAEYFTSSKMKNSASGPKKTVSPMPMDLTMPSARLAMPRGSRLYGSPVVGSSTSQTSERVVSAKNGSMQAEAGSGIRFMSDS